MSKAIFAALLLTGSAHAASAQVPGLQLDGAKLPAPLKDTRAANTAQIIELARGGQKTLHWAGLTQLHALDARIVHVRIEAGDTINLTGLEAGETWLQISHGAHESTLLKVRVAADELGEQRLGQISGGQPLGAGTATSTPSTAPLGTADTSLQGTRRPTLPRLQIAVQPAYGLDTERLRFLSGDPANPTASTLTARRSFQSLTVTLRRRLGARNTLTLDVPYLRRREDVKFGNVSSSVRSSGLGDIFVGFERVFPGLARGTVEGSAGLNLALPTGQSIYNLGRNKLPLGSGHYEVGGFLGLRKIADPLFASASLGLNYTLARNIQGTRVAPGLGYSLQTGLGYAINDRLVLSEQLSFSRRTNVNLIGTLGAADALSQKADQAYFTQSLIYNPRRGSKSARLFFTVGLNDASLDYILGLTLQR